MNEINTQTVNLEKKMKLRWAFKRFYQVLIIWPIAVIATWIFVQTQTKTSLADILWPAFFMLLVILVLCTPFILISTIRLKSFKYSILGANLVINQGILKKESRTLLLSTCQNTRIIQTLPNRMFGLSSVLVEDSSGLISKIDKNGKVAISRHYQREAIGFSGNRINFPALKYKDAISLVDILRTNSNPST